jgi:hypothetical protein
MNWSTNLINMKSSALQSRCFRKIHQEALLQLIIHHLPAQAVITPKDGYHLKAPRGAGVQLHTLLKDN